MILWLCDFEDCNKASVRTHGECILCNRHRCVEHLGLSYHTCPRWETRTGTDTFVHCKRKLSTMRLPSSSVE
ncbi:hypothetical protein N7533_006075 [Penicillium manginii]|uniref:uncharacterized protein n=1 Tax=Penicillium manginii TaxID=203109 RepID=UPI002546C48A|nr:uncharacterized protein N7533_006075 [Penicillium manginii]KAJ5756532.1 hypothetical protein N7533_006075 [Penicillium manginii]